MSLWQTITGGAARAAEFTLDKLGLSWVTGGPVGVSATTPIAPIVIELSVPEDYPSPGGPFPGLHQGTIILNIPNHSTQFGDIAINMAQNALGMLELAVAVQTIVDEEGGLRIKDQLDPYHYQVVKTALEENNETVPPVTEPQANVLNDLGGGITETGILSGLVTAADGLAAVSESYNFLNITPQTYSVVPNFGGGGAAFTDLPDGTNPPVGTPISPMAINITGEWPDYSFPLSIMNSAIAIQGFVTSYAVSNIRNAIDTESRALLLKGVLGEWGQQVNNDAIQDTNGTPPDWEEPSGTGGVR